MTISTYANPGDCCASESRFNLAQVFSRFQAYLKQREKQYQDLRRLSELTDDQLRDIGLHRGDIREAVYGCDLDRIRNEYVARR